MGGKIKFVKCERCGIEYIHYDGIPHACLLDETKELFQKIWERKNEKHELVEKFSYKQGISYKLKHKPIPETIQITTDEPYTIIREFAYVNKTQEIKILTDKYKPKDIYIRYVFWKDKDL